MEMQIQWEKEMVRNFRKREKVACVVLKIVTSGQQNTLEFKNPLDTFTKESVGGGGAG